MKANCYQMPICWSFEGTERSRSDRAMSSLYLRYDFGTDYKFIHSAADALGCYTEIVGQIIIGLFNRNRGLSYKLMRKSSCPNRPYRGAFHRHRLRSRCSHRSVFALNISMTVLLMLRKRPA